MSLNNETSETPLIERVNGAIRDNPLAAGLIGAGLAWMIFGAKGFSALGGLAVGASEKVASAATSAGEAVAGIGTAAGSAGSKISTAIKDASDEAATGLSSLVPDLSIGNAGRQVAGMLSSKGSEYSFALKSRFSESLEQQPLLIGVIGLAVGAGIASTFASTSIESEWLGTQGSAVREKFEDVVDETKRQGSEFVSNLKDEATRQGMTREGAAALVSKVSNVASAATKAITD